MISKDKTYRTKNGYAWRYYDTGGQGQIHGAYEGHTWHGWQIGTWESDGTHTGGNPALDLVEVKPRIKREYWMNVYPNDERSGLCNSKLFAEQVAREGRIACVKVVIDAEEGEGL